MMLEFDKNQYELFKRYVIPVYEGNADIKTDDNACLIAFDDTAKDDVLDAADYAIIHYGMVEFDYLTPLGCQLQILFDEIYYQLCQERK